MSDNDRLDWWAGGEMCESCGISYCARHKPSADDDSHDDLVGPLGTTGLESVRLGPIEVLYLDYHTASHGERSLVGEAVLRAKSYDGRIGSIGDAQRVARASATWLSKWFNGGRVERPVAIVAVPPKPERRGLSLPAVLADVIGRDLGLPVVAPLCWLGGTAQAKHLPVDERQRALSSMLRVVAPCPPGTILVVDDVFQTGATISALARELGKIGASRVVAFAPSRARVPRRSRGR